MMYYLDEIGKLLSEQDMLSSVILKAGRPVEEVKVELGALWGEVTFMPVVRIDNVNNARAVIEGYLAEGGIPAIEITFKNDQNPLLESIPELKEKGMRIWLNSLWPSLNGGHDDDLAYENPDAAFGWLLNKGADIIQADRPRRLLEYLGTWYE